MMMNIKIFAKQQKHKTSIPSSKQDYTIPNQGLKKKKKPKQIISRQMRGKQQDSVMFFVFFLNVFF